MMALSTRRHAHVTGHIGVSNLVIYNETLTIILSNYLSAGISLNDRTKEVVHHFIV